MTYIELNSTAFVFHFVHIYINERNFYYFIQNPLTGLRHKSIEQIVAIMNFKLCTVFLVALFAVATNGFKIKEAFEETFKDFLASKSLYFINKIVLFINYVF